MAPRPLKTLKRQCEVFAIGPFSMWREPKLAVLVAGAIAAWSCVEARVSTLVIMIMGAEAKAAIAMLSALTSFQAQSAAIRAVISTKIPKEQHDVFDVVLLELRKTAKRRHKLAHWLWGASPNLPGHMLLGDPEVYLQMEVSKHLIFQKDPERKLNKFVAPYDGIWVYGEKDLRDLLTDIEAVDRLLSSLLALASKHPTSADILRQLSAEPRLQIALGKRQGNPSKSAVPPPQ